MLSCEVVTDLMAVYESGEASAETRRLVEEHLAGCAACRAALERGTRVESVLSQSESVRVERPLNGKSFVSRTRRLFFVAGAAVLLLFAVQAAFVMRFFGRRPGESPFGGMHHEGFGVLPASPLLALVVAAGTAVVYIILVFTASRRLQDTSDGAVARAVSGGVFLTILAGATFYLWIMGPASASLVSSLFLLVALIVTVSRLSNLPYFTIVTLASLFVAIVFFLNAVLVGRMVGRF